MSWYVILINKTKYDLAYLTIFRKHFLCILFTRGWWLSSFPIQLHMFSIPYVDELDVSIYVIVMHIFIFMVWISCLLELVWIRGIFLFDFLFLIEFLLRSLWPMSNSRLFCQLLFSWNPNCWILLNSIVHHLTQIKLIPVIKWVGKSIRIWVRDLSLYGV